jgi:hypothetical protein
MEAGRFLNRLSRSDVVGFTGQAGIKHLGAASSEVQERNVAASGNWHAIGLGAPAGLMSLVGHFRKSRLAQVTSGLPSTTDIPTATGMSEKCQQVTSQASPEMK